MGTIKGNKVSAVYINGRVRTLPLPIRELQKEKKSERESSCSCIGLHLSNRSKVEGKVHFLTSLLPFHSFNN